MSETKVCPKCGNPISEGMKFCIYCGNKLEVEQPSKQMQQTQQRNQQKSTDWVTPKPQPQPEPAPQPKPQPEPAPQPKPQPEPKPQPTAEAREVNGPQAPKKKSKLPIIIGVVIAGILLVGLLLIVAVVGVIFVINKNRADDATALVTETQTEIETEEDDFIYDDGDNGSGAEEELPVYVPDDVSAPEDQGENPEAGNDFAQPEYEDTPMESEYLLPGSDSRYISESELYGFTQEEVRIAKNELFARHGRTFKDQGLQAHFDSKSWYVGVSRNIGVDSLNSIEKANLKVIQDYEKSMGY